MTPGQVSVFYNKFGTVRYRFDLKIDSHHSLKNKRLSLLFADSARFGGVRVAEISLRNVGAELKIGATG